MSINDYEFISVIQQGLYGKVWKVKQDDKIYALKIIKYQPSIATAEYEIMNKFNHKNIIKCNKFFIDDFIYYIVMDYMETDLFEFAKSNTVIKFKDVMNILYQILSGIRYMHSINYIHCDLKMENILFNPITNQIKICDFATCLSLLDTHNNVFEIKNDVVHLKKVIGTKYCMAPEVSHSKTVSYQTDIWNFGKIAGYLSTKLSIITRRKLHIIIDKCLNVEYLKRPSLEEINTLMNEIQ
jgi:serine/threonine protein kinase